MSNHFSSLNNESPPRDGQGNEYNQNVTINTTCSIFLSNLSANVTKAHLREICGNYGTIKNLDLSIPQHHQSDYKAMGLVEYEFRDDAKRAIEFLDGMSLDHMTICAYWTTAKKIPAADREKNEMLRLFKLYNKSITHDSNLYHSNDRETSPVKYSHNYKERSYVNSPKRYRDFSPVGESNTRQTTRVKPPPIRKHRSPSPAKQHVKNRYSRYDLPSSPPPPSPRSKYYSPNRDRPQTSSISRYESPRRRSHHSSEFPPQGQYTSPKSKYLKDPKYENDSEHEETYPKKQRIRPSY